MLSPADENSTSVDEEGNQLGLDVSALSPAEENSTSVDK